MKNSGEIAVSISSYDDRLAPVAPCPASTTLSRCWREAIHQAQEQAAYSTIPVRRHPSQVARLPTGAPWQARRNWPVSLRSHRLRERTQEGRSAREAIPVSRVQPWLQSSHRRSPHFDRTMRRASLLSELPG